MSTGRKILKGLHLVFDFLILLIIIGCIFVSYFIHKQGFVERIIDSYYQAKEIVQMASADDFTHNESGTSYYDIDKGTILMSYKGRYLSYDEIPSKAIDAIIAIEDNRFFAHKGVDLQGILRAIYYAIESKGETIQGGSTITQQLMKLEYVGSERNISRKIIEAFCAMMFETKFTKTEIMEFYLNTIYFANQYYGIDAAAYGYYGKDITQLSTAELAFILAIPNSPSRYDPYDNFEGTKGRQERILKAMLDNGYLTEKEYVNSLNEKIILVEKGSQDVLIDNRNEYPFSYIEREAIKAIMRSKGFEFKYYFKNEDESADYEARYEALYEQAKQELASGYVVHTSISKSLQEGLQTTIDEYMNGIDMEKTEEDVYAYQSAATVIDNESGLIVAMVGGRDDASFLNRAYQSYRQPGSTIKPILDYAPAIELKGYKANSILNDHPIEGGCKNYNGRYVGNITLRNAVAQSINTTAWQLLEEITPEKGLSYLKNMNFSRIVEGDYNLATSIGGFTYGVSTVEMASAYAALYNDGIYRSPSCIRYIYDHTGNCIYSYEDEKNARQVYNKETANQMVDILTSVFDGTARGLRVKGFCAAKTGTTNDGRDSWFCGITETYSTAVWVGRDDSQAMKSGISAGKIWNGFTVNYDTNRSMEHYDLHTSSATQVESVQQTESENINVTDVVNQNTIVDTTVADENNEIDIENGEVENGVENENSDIDETGVVELPNDDSENNQDDNINDGTDEGNVVEEEIPENQELPENENVETIN